MDQIQRISQRHEQNSNEMNGEQKEQEQYK